MLSLTAPIIFGECRKYFHSLSNYFKNKSVSPEFLEDGRLPFVPSTPLNHISMTAKKIANYSAIIETIICMGLTLLGYLSEDSLPSLNSHIQLSSALMLTGLTNLIITSIYLIYKQSSARSDYESLN